MNTLLKTSLAAITIAVSLTGSSNAEEVSPRIYVMPDEARCVVRKADKTTYCTDKSGTPITGELHKYRDNVILRLYPLQNGLLHGTAVTYDAKGRKKTEKEYINGVLNGASRTYVSSGALESEILYTSGKKQGVAKFYNEDGSLFAQAQYANNRLNGNMRLYAAGGKILYGLTNTDDKYTSGTYYYLAPDGSVVQTEIPAVILSAVNHKCLKWQHEMSSSACAAVFEPGDNAECDENWRRRNRPAVRRYLAACAKGKRYE